MVDLNVVLLPKQHRCAYWYMGAFRNRSTYLIWVLINKNQMLGGKGGGGVIIKEGALIGMRALIESLWYLFNVYLFY